MTNKQEQYAALVERRKQCGECDGLTNPTVCCGGCLDGPEIGPWTRWQADLDARLVVIGQDWGDDAAFINQHGMDLVSSATNRLLGKLLESVGFKVAEPSRCGVPQRNGVLLTNAILCLKKGGAQAVVESAWFDACAKRFLQPLVELVNPRVVVCLGQRAYRALMKTYELRPLRFRDAVESDTPARIECGPTIVPVYHCSRRILNTHRCESAQFNDWQRVRKVLDANAAEQ